MQAALSHRRGTEICKAAAGIAVLGMALLIAGALQAQTPTPEASPTATPLQDLVPPTFTITIPAAGTRTDESAVIFTGTVSDDREVLRVQWRREGESWRRAILNFATSSDTDESKVTSATWAFTSRLLPGRRTTTFFIRAQDGSLNESDTIGRPIRRR